MVRLFLGSCLALAGCAPAGDPSAPARPEKTDVGPDSSTTATGWTVDSCLDTLVPTGNQVGDIAEDFALTDAAGAEVRLHQFCDHVVLLVGCAMWHPSCQVEADRVADLSETRGEAGLVVVTLQGENAHQEPATVDDLAAWADRYSLDHPVLADDGFEVMQRYVDGNSLGLPSMTLLDRGAVILHRDTYVDESQLEEVLAGR